MKCPSKVGRLSYVLLCVSFLVSSVTGAAHGGRGRRDATSSLLAARAKNKHQEEPVAHDPDAQPSPPTTTIATTTDIGKARLREARDIAWKAAGEATEARAASSKLRSKINRIGAGQKTAAAGEWAAAGLNVYGPQAAQSQASAQAALKKALSSEAEVKKIAQTVDEHAYKAAKAAAEKEVSKLEGEAKKYYQSLLAKFKALADPGPPTAAQAAAKAAQPYIDVELRVGALVQYYNEKAIADIAQAQATVMQAKNIAVTAQNEQTAGVVDMAQRHMMQAHMLIGAANLKKQEAYKVRKLAESLNMSIPSYQKAAQQAAAHALATFAGLQLGDKAHVEMRQRVAESTRQVEQGLAELEAALAQASQALSAFDAVGAP